MQLTSPVYTANLFTPLHDELMLLLRELSPGDWQRPTIAGDWRVRDIVAHLLDVDLRKLSVNRDRHLPPQPAEPFGSYRDLVGFLNGLNAEWVTAARRLSEPVLIELNSFTGPLVSHLVSSLPPHEPSVFPVGWAGETESENWFDIGRDYTERWHHQMQIRDAVGAPLLLANRWLFPLLDISFRALPYAYRDFDAPSGTAVTVQVGEDAWTVLRDDEQWKLFNGEPVAPTASVRIDPDSAWRLLYNALPSSIARQNVNVEGDIALAEPMFTVRSVMA